MYTYHLLFMHLSVTRYLSCFYLLAIANNTAINRGYANISSPSCFQFLCLYSQVELLELHLFVIALTQDLKWWRVAFGVS